MSEKTRVKIISKNPVFKEADSECCPGYVFTADPACEDYDWVVVFDDLKGDASVTCPKERTILATWEPECIKNYSTAFTRQFGHLLTNRSRRAENHPHYHRGAGYFPWFVGRSHAEIRDFAAPEKTKTVSAICSTKAMRWTQHHNRIELMMRLKAEVPGFELAGHGIRELTNKSELLDEFRYHVAFENHIANGYWSEKIADALLCECLPFYVGAPDIGRDLPREAFIALPPDDPDAAVKIVKEVIANDEWSKRLPAIREAKRLLLEQFNFYAQVAQVIEEARNQPIASGGTAWTIHGSKYFRRHSLAANLEAGWFHFRQYLSGVGLWPTMSLKKGSDQEQILVIKHGALGDFVMASGALRTVRALHPHAHIALITEGFIADFARRMGLFDEIIIDSRGYKVRTWWNVIVRVIAGRRWERIYDFQASNRTLCRYYPLALAATRHPMKWGRRVRGEMVYRVNSGKIPFFPWFWRNRSFGKIEWMENDLSMCHGEGRNFALLPERYALLVPGCSAGNEQKRWPCEWFRALTDYLAAKGLKSVVMGTKAEAKEIAAICGGNANTVDFLGKSSVADIPDMANRAAVVVGNDTGPSHIAHIAGARTVMMFREFDYNRAAPKGKRNVISLCGKTIRDIPLESVVAAVERMLNDAQ